MASGKSMSVQNSKGIRKTNRDGQELAPRSLRRVKKLLKNCSQESLEKLGIYEEKIIEGE